MRKDRITVRLMGGLGNQIFQYVFGRQIAADNGMELYLDTSSYLRDKKRRYSLDWFNIKAKKLNSIDSLYYNIQYYIFVKLGRKSKKLVTEKRIFCHDEIVTKGSSYCIGYWINEDYFKRIKQELVDTFNYQGQFTEQVKNIIAEVKYSESVAVHVRRGDYLTNGNDATYITQGKKYYDEARKYIESKKNNLKFFVFSDDIDWCKENLGWQDAIFIDDSITDDDIVQFEIMKNCRNFIIGNSTYSWWAAWLARNDDRICIAPSKWYVNKKSNEACLSALCKDFAVV